MKDILSSSKVFFFLFFSALILRCEFETVYPRLLSDHSIQIQAAKSYLQTGSFSTTWTSAENLGEIHSAPLALWPTGLSFVILFFNFFTHDLILAEICFQLLTVILFLSAAIKLFKYFGMEQLYINLFLIMYAFNFSPFAYLGSTDFFTGALFLWIVFIALRETSGQLDSFLSIVLLALLIAICGCIRFACIPNCVIVPGYYMLLAYFSKRKEFFFKGIWILAISALLLVLFYRLFPIDSSRTSFLEALRQGVFFFSSLKWMDPFFIKSLFFSRPIEFHLPGNPVLIRIYRILLQLSSISLALFVFLRFFKRLKFGTWLRDFKANNSDKYNRFGLMFLITFLVVVGFISLQSLTVPPESNSFGPSWMPHYWTHVYSTRYFINVVFLFIIMFFVSFSRAENAFHKKFFVGSYLVFVTWALGYWLFMNFQFFVGNGAGSPWVNERSDITAYKLCNKLHDEEPLKCIVLARHQKKIDDGLVASYSKAFPTDDYTRIIKNDFKNSSPLILVMLMPKQLSEEETVFLREKNGSVLYSDTKEQIIRVNLE